jgi:hypothetical protein
MLDQYVYVARLINHRNEFLEGYYKLGFSKQYTIREKNLAPTNLPFDGLLVRLFRTDNMRAVEAVFHTCFEDYRAIKKYDDGKSIKTEYFWMDDEEMFYGRIDKLVKYLPNVQEMDLVNEIKNDVTISKEDKEDLIKNFRKTKSRLSFIFDGNDLSQDNSTDTFLSVLKHIAEQSSWDKIMEHEIRVTRTFEELRDRNPSASESQLKHFENHYIFTGNNNEVKVKNLNKIMKKLNIKNIHVSIKK